MTEKLKAYVAMIEAVRIAQCISISRCHSTRIYVKLHKIDTREPDIFICTGSYNLVLITYAYPKEKISTNRDWGTA